MKHYAHVSIWEQTDRDNLAAIKGDPSINMYSEYDGFAHFECVDDNSASTLCIALRASGHDVFAIDTVRRENNDVPTYEGMMEQRREAIDRVPTGNTTYKTEQQDEM